MKYDVLNYPWTHGYSKEFIDEDRASLLCQDFPAYHDEVWEKFGKVFKSEYGYKKELTDKSAMPKSIVDFLCDLESEDFIQRISDDTGIDNLFIDEGLYGGGLNFYPPGSHLTTHIDFNYNNDIEAYRSVNLLFYLNDDWDEDCGGCFEMFDTQLNKGKIVVPQLNTCVFFATNNKTYHGVSKTQNNFHRKSISIWYYTKEPTKDLSAEPHKTLWVK